MSLFAKTSKKRTSRLNRCVLARWSTFVCLLVGLVAFQPRTVYAYGDPHEAYFELESEHFVVHSPVSREAFATRAIQIAEEAHRVLAPKFDSVSREKTHIAIEDHIDDANGWARVVSRNEIHLYAWTPEVDEELGNYDDWMRLLIYHEYTHVLHMDVSDNGFYTFLNAVMGKFARGNATLPRWFTEGLAVYSETQTSTGGRLRSPIYQSMIRNAALDGRLPTLGGMSVGLVDWPAGAASYLYGAFFIQWLAQNYGEHKIIEYIHAYSRQVIPYAMNRVAVRTFGKTWDQLWDQWRRYEISRAHSQKAAYSLEEAETPANELISPFRHGHPVARPKYDQFVYARNDGAHRRMLMFYDVHTHGELPLTECWGTCQSAWSNDGETLYFIHSEAIDGYIQQASLYAYDMSRKTTYRVTRDAHVRSVGASASSLYLVVQEHETSSVVRVSLNALHEDMALREFEVVYAAAPFEQLDEINVWGQNSPDDDRLVLSRFDPEAVQHDIAWNTVGDLKNNSTWQDVTHSDVIDMSPTFSWDGQTITYVSPDTRGALQRYAYTLATGHTVRTTHRLEGIMTPTTLANGDVVYMHYTSRGQGIARILASELVTKPVESGESGSPDAANVVFAKKLKNIEVKERADKPWRWMFPQSWTPSFSGNMQDVTVGLSFSGRDFLDHHHYAVAADYQSRIDSFDFAFDYEYLRLLWNIGLSAGCVNSTAWWFDGHKNREFEYQNATASVYATRSVSGRTFGSTFLLGFNVSHVQSSERFSWSLSDPTGKPPRLPSFGWQNALVFKYTFSTMRSFEKAVGRSDGVTLSTNLRLEAPWLGDSAYALIASANLRAFWTMPYLETHAFGVELAGGGSYVQDAGRTPFSLSTSTAFSLSSLLSQSSSDAMIHGYAEGNLVGNHYLYAHAEYNFGLLDAQLGHSTLPVGLQRISMSVFGDWGYAWQAGEFDMMRSSPAVGAALHFDLGLGYRLVQRVTVGYAYGDHHQVYFGLF